MEELRQPKIPFSHIKLAPDRINLLLGEHFTLTRLHTFTTEVDRDGSLLTPQERQHIYYGFEGFLPRLRQAMVHQFGAEIGQERIEQFFSHFNLQRVLVIKQDRYTQITHNDSENVGTFTNNFGGVIFIKEIPPSQEPNPQIRQEEYNRVLLEETLHMFLTQVDLPFSTRLLKTARLIVHEARNIPYEEEPEEYIVSAMIERLLPTLFPESKDHESATDVTQGNELIARVGWKFILERKY